MGNFNRPLFLTFSIFLSLIYTFSSFYSFRKQVKNQLRLSCQSWHFGFSSIIQVYLWDIFYVLSHMIIAILSMKHNNQTLQYSTYFFIHCAFDISLNRLERRLSTYHRCWHFGSFGLDNTLQYVNIQNRRG